MKITSGRYRNYKIRTPKISSNLQKQIGFHPTKGKVKQAIFNILQHARYVPENFLHNATILDICCGSGAYGIEALSLDAKFVLFIDNNINMINIIRSNIEHLGITCDRYAILQEDITKISEKTQICYDKDFNIVFIDLPYKDAQNIEQTLCTLRDKNWIKKDCIIVVETTRYKFLPYPIVNQTRKVKKLHSVIKNDKRVAINLADNSDINQISSTFCIIDERLYGRTRVIILRYIQ